VSAPARAHDLPGAGRYALEVALVVVLGAAAGLLANGLRRDGLPYDLPDSVLHTESGVRAVFIGEAHRLYEAADYIFVDARERAEFRAGHIEGALSLPMAEFSVLYPELQTWAAGQPVLVYGSGRNLLAPDGLASLLREKGEKKLLLFVSGIESWRARGYPIATGTDGEMTEGGAAPAEE
jgi:3-mercaptopyruvate sulfurtransferase SseA